MNINPKVAMGTAGGSLGGACVVVLLWWFQEGLGISPDQFTVERVVALTTIMTVVPGFIAGWATSAFQIVKAIDLEKKDEIR